MSVWLVAPAKALLSDLILAEAKALVFDPIAMETAQKELPAEWFESGSVKLASTSMKYCRMLMLYCW